METRANYVIVGIFTLAAIVAAFAFVYWTAAIGDRGETITLRVRIPGSASGLGRGSAVLFNGVKVGDVTRVFIDVQNPSAAIADTTIDRLTPITTSTQADIGIAGLTGQANIELKGGNLKEPNILDQAEAKGRIPEITADPSAVTNLLQTAQDIFERADRVINNLEGFVDSSRAPLEQTAKNAQTFSDALARNADGIDKFLASVSQLSDTVTNVSGRLDGTLTSAQEILEAVDREKVRRFVDNAESISADLRSTAERIDGISARVDGVVASADTIVRSFNDTAQTVNDVAKQSKGTLTRVDGILEAVNPETVRSALANVEETSRSATAAAANIRDLSQRAGPVVDDVAKITASLGSRTGQIEQFIADAGALANRLSGASERVGSVIGRADDILQGVDPDTLRSALSNVEETSRSANAAAANIRDLSQRAGPIVDNVARVADNASKVSESLGSRTRQIEQLIADAGALANRLSGASERVGSVIGRADDILQGVDPEAVRQTVDTVQQAASTANRALVTIQDASQTVSNIANDVNRVTSRVSARTDQIDQFVADAGQLAGRLNAASVRVDGILQRVDGILGSDQTNGLVAEASETLRSFRQVAETLNGRIGPIADNLQRFSGQGLQGITGLVQDSQRAVNRIENAVDDLQRNPQRILSGGDGEVRRYNGRARR